MRSSFSSVITNFSPFFAKATMRWPFTRWIKVRGKARSSLSRRIFFRIHRFDRRQPEARSARHSHLSNRWLSEELWFLSQSLVLIRQSLFLIGIAVLNNIGTLVSSGLSNRLCLAMCSFWVFHVSKDYLRYRFVSILLFSILSHWSICFFFFFE